MQPPKCHGKAAQGNVEIHSEKVEEAEVVRSREREDGCLHMASHTIAPGRHPAPGTGTAQKLLVTGEVPRLLGSSLPAFCLVSLFNSSLVRIQK